MSVETSKDETAAEAVNEVHLAGRVSGDPEERVLPSGDVVWTFRSWWSRETARSGVSAWTRWTAPSGEVEHGARSPGGGTVTWCR